MITITYSTIDRVHKRRKFKTLKGARKFALEWVGPQDVEGGSYAVSFDGVGKVTWRGVTRRELFGDESEIDQLDCAYKAEKAALDAAYAKAVATGSPADNDLYQALKAEFDWTYAPSMTAEDREMMAVEMADKIKRRKEV